MGFAAVKSFIPISHLVFDAPVAIVDAAGVACHASVSSHIVDAEASPSFDIRDGAYNWRDLVDERSP